MALGCGCYFWNMFQDVGGGWWVGEGRMKLI